jgi:hypothetical protein
MHDDRPRNKTAILRLPSWSASCFLREPLACGYQFYAFPLGILAAHQPARDWVLSNFVQAVWDPADPSPMH